MMAGTFRRKSRVCFLLSSVVFFLSSLSGFAGVNPTDPSYEASTLAAPTPSVFAWNSAIAYYDGRLIYADADDGRIYAYDLAANGSVEVCDTSALSTAFSSVTGFLVSDDGYLYFHDNGNSVNIYRVRLTDAWPTDYEFFNTACNGSIYAFTQNPWTGAVWFCSADFFVGNKLYLYEVNASFDGAVQRAAFAKPHGDNAGNGPIIFKERDTILYGESVWGGDGYFHLIDAATGEVMDEDYMTFDGGLAGATYGYDNVIFAATGAGEAIVKVQGAAATEIAVTEDDAQNIVFDGFSFYMSEQNSSGAVSLYEVWNTNAIAGVNPTDPSYEASALAAPSPSVFAWNSAIAYYDGRLIYADAADGKIYAYDLAANGSVEVCDTSALSTAFSSVTGFLVSDDGYLYFHDNGNSVNIYRVRLTDAWPADYESLDTACHGYIYAFTQNPWTGAIWFSSADFGAGNLYAYEVNASFSGALERTAFAKPHGTNAGNGPIIFKERDVMLYGESVWGGDGYFHLLDIATGEVTDEDYLTFDGGLAGAAYGYDNVIFAATGAGKAIVKVQGAAATEIAATEDDAQNIVFDGFSFYISEQKSSDFSGAVSLWALWQLTPTGIPVGQAAPEGMVEGDMAVTALGVTGSKAVGIGAADSGTIVEFAEAMNPGAISDNRNRPGSLSFGLVNFRLKVTDPDGTATVTVYLSEEVPAGARWYKYDSINGWNDYSAHATLLADRRSFALAFQDGGYGDSDRIVNGYITDPGGVAVSSESSPAGGSSNTGSSSPGGGGSGCFIAVCSADMTPMRAWLPFLFCSCVVISYAASKLLRRS